MSLAVSFQESLDVLSKRKTCVSCGNHLIEAPLEDSTMEQTVYEKVCSKCGLVHGVSNPGKIKPYYRRPAHPITYDKNLGTDHYKLVKSIIAQERKRLAVGKHPANFEGLSKNDSDVYFNVVYLYSKRDFLDSQLMRKLLELLSLAVRRLGRYNDQNFVNIAATNLRRLVKQHFDDDVIAQLIARSIKLADQEVFLKKLGSNNGEFLNENRGRRNSYK